MNPSDIRANAKGKIVLCGGVFDIIHPGHIFFLTEAKKHGNFLVVVIARDSTAKRLKREPIVTEDQRAEVVAALKPVDIAIIGHEGGDFMKIVSEIKPDIIAIGYNQIHDEESIERRLKEFEINCEVKRITKIKKGNLLSTKNIIEKIKSRLF